EMREVVKAVREDKEIDATTTKIMVGGSPVTKEFAMNIGADGYADDAYSAIRWVNENIEA
ncbi:MAG: cobalamin-binding protein, partial [Eubacteriaceae bacterium]